MRCKVCGWPDGTCKENDREYSFFFIYLRKKFLESMTVPCFARDQVDNMVHKVMHVATHEKKKYVFEVKKGSYKTRIRGPGYNKFLSDYDMKPGDRIRFKLDKPRQFVRIIPEKLEDESEETVIEPHVFEESASAVVFSGGLELTAGQTSMMNHCVLTRGLGLGGVFVHTITKTDVQQIGLRIPKDIVSVLNIYNRGYAILSTENGNNTSVKKTEYYTSTDGRVCLTKGWKDYAKENGLNAGVVMLILFSRDNNDYLNISFDVL